MADDTCWLMQSHSVADFRKVQKTKKMQLVIPCDYEVAA
jgi:hypothetical protein